MTSPTPPTAAPGSALAKVYAALIESGCVYGSGEDWTCPTHEDERPSLGVAQGKKGVVLHCAAGCENDDILKALRLKKRDLFDAPNSRGSSSSGSASNSSDGKSRKSGASGEDEADPGVSTVYVYKNLAGETLRKVYRTDYRNRPKQIRQRVISKAAFLYRAPELAAALGKGKSVVIVEGEKSVHRLLDYFAQHKALKKRFEVTTMPQGGGTGKWLDGYTKFLVKHKCAQVIIIADNDSTGYKHAQSVRTELEMAGISVQVKASATDGKHDDICEHLDAGFGLRELVALDERALTCILADAPEGESAIVSRGRSVPRIWPNANTPDLVACKWLDVFHSGDRLVYWREMFYEWRKRENRWREIEDQELRKRMYSTFSRAAVHGDSGDVPWTPTKSKLDTVLDALRARAHLSAEIEDGEFRDGRAGDFIAFRDCNYNIANGSLSEKTPEFFNQISYPFEFPAEKQECAQWLKFLHSLWRDDAASISALQEWFGYVLSGRLHLHKALMLLGPPRSGKSTIAHILAQVIGQENTVWPTFGSLGTDFGLSGWLGKSLAVFADARFAPRDAATVSERLLRISAGDGVEVNRKFRQPVSTTLPTRMMIISNEFPNIVENSGALLKRFVVLETKESFYDREDTGLTAKLEAELPGILQWALEGMARILEREHFTTIAATRDLIRDMSHMMSPTQGFFEECVEITPGHGRVARQDLYEAFRLWCMDQGISNAPTQAVFGRNLNAAFPKIACVQYKKKRYYAGLSLKRNVGQVG